MIDNVYDGKLLFKKDGILRQVTSKEKLCELIYDTIDFYKNMADDYREEANKTYEEAYEEVKEELKNLKAAYSRTPIHFSGVESFLYNTFVHKHNNKGCHKGYSISIQGAGGVRVAYKVICNDCGELEDITDIESW